MSSAGGRLGWGGDEVIVSQCSLCRRFVGEHDACAAFQGGIPAEILGNRRSHLEPIEGDGGLFFVPIKDGDRDRAVEMIRRAGRPDPVAVAEALGSAGRYLGAELDI